LYVDISETIIPIMWLFSMKKKESFNVNKQDWYILMILFNGYKILQIIYMINYKNFLIEKQLKHIFDQK
jgi:hypothetical protein